MLARFLFWLKNLFSKDDEEFGPDYSEVRKIKPSRYNTDDYTKRKERKTQSSSSKSSSKPNVKNKSSTTTEYIPSKEGLMKQIKSNIFFLEQLQELLLENENYFSYQKKVMSMLKNSHNSYKIISRLRDDAPYYENTMEMIYRHTNSISSILEIST